MSSYLAALMDIYWLRPETAAWRACDCLALEDVEFVAPIADVGCGDGLFSFTRAGGRIDRSYDMFSQVERLGDFFSNVDIFNHFDETAATPQVTVAPRYTIDVGVDHKQSLLDKAAALGFYTRTMTADANVSLPLEDGKYNTIYSNILYWLEDYGAALREMRRSLNDSGKVVLQVPNDTFKDYSFYQRLFVRTGDERWKWLSLIDRGRSENIKQCKSYSAWSAIFAEAGFKVSHHKLYLSKPLLEAWDIGLRPLSPFLIEMANGLSKEKRLDIKKRWVEALLPLVAPFCEIRTPFDETHPPGFHLFVLEKRA